MVSNRLLQNYELRERVETTGKWDYSEKGIVEEENAIEFELQNLPCALIIEEPVGSLLKLLSDSFRLLVALKPSLILLVEAPTLIFEGFRSKVLLICTLPVVEHVKKCVRVHASVYSRIIKYGQRFLGIVTRCLKSILGLVIPRLFSVCPCR